MLSLLEQGDWESDAALIQGLKAWPLSPLLLETYESLQEDALYKSRVHGSGHIHRVLLFAALIAWQEALPEDLVRQLFRAAAYHDVGRTFDGYDLDHGARSAQRLEELTGQTGEALAELQAAVTAHALPDARLEETVHAFHPADFDRAVELTRLLKDADNLDRVHLGDLKVKFLRHESAKNLADFALRLLARDQLWKERGKE